MGTGAGPTPHGEGPGSLGWWCGRKAAWPQQEKATDAKWSWGPWCCKWAEGLGCPQREVWGLCVLWPRNRFDSAIGLMSPPVCPSYTCHLPLSLCFNPCASVSFLFPHFLVSLQPLLFSFALIYCPLGLSAAFEASSLSCPTF